MSDIDFYFSPIEVDVENAVSESFASVFSIHTTRFPSLEGVDIAIIGVCEDRLSPHNKGCAKAPHSVRKQLYKLFPGSFTPRIADLGNIKPGHTEQDTFFALSDSISFLIKKNIVPIIIGGSQDLTFAQFKGYEKLEQTINMVSIDASFDLGTADNELNSQTFLGKILLYQPNFLFNYSQIGHQTYLVPQSSLTMMNKLYFDTYRLGQIRDNITESEPIIRHADMMSFDISALKHSDAPAHARAQPNGFYAEEACQMMRYAGMSDKLTSVGLYEINPAFDVQEKTAALAAQMIWCFIEGFYGRKKDQPSKNNPEYTRFHVFLQDHKYEINFYKSNKSDRWWMEVPYPPDKKLKFERHTLIPCSYKDYETACKDEIPDRWWQTYQKLY
ncbi:MAG: formimidoylglutamase [Bacteroidetes bacterium]|nr:formimidoylglutamase [Bacteroidota bacterium]